MNDLDCARLQEFLLLVEDRPTLVLSKPTIMPAEMNCL